MIIETNRLLIRPFVSADLLVIHRILDEAFPSADHIDHEAALAERRTWVQWSILNEEWLAKLHQPPYGDRAIALRTTGELIGSIGYVPCLNPFEQIPELRTTLSNSGFTTTEFGLFWAIDPQHQRRGYATEAARAMVEYAFRELRLKRIIATTDYLNLASQRVMEKIGMTLAHNPLPEPAWLQVVGILDNHE